MEAQNAEYIRSLIARAQDRLSQDLPTTLEVMLFTGETKEAHWIEADDPDGVIIHGMSSRYAMPINAIVGIRFHDSSIDTNAADRRILPFRMKDVLEGIVFQVIVGQNEIPTEQQIAELDGMSRAGRDYVIAEEGNDVNILSATLKHMANFGREMTEEMRSVRVADIIEMIDADVSANVLRKHAEVSQEDVANGKTLADIEESHARHLADVVRYVRARRIARKAYKPMIRRDDWKSAVSADINRAIGDA